MDAQRRLLLASAAGAAASALSKEAFSQPAAPVAGSEHWTYKQAGGEKVRLFLWRKRLRDPAAGGSRRGTIVFVHGSSMASTPVFDLRIPGKPELSVMDWFARLGYDTWCFDCEGYGRSDKQRPINASISDGADDLVAVSEYIAKTTSEKLLLYGASSGALRAALFAQREPRRVARLALDAFVWTGEGSPTLAERKKRIAQWRASNRRPIDRAFVHSIFTRDHPGTTDHSTIEAFADAVLALDTSVPTGTYLDMSANLPVVEPEKIGVPTLIMRGQWDGIAGLQDLVNFYLKLPNPDKQFTVMPGIAHSSLRAKNWALVFHILDSFFSQPAPVHTG